MTPLPKFPSHPTARHVGIIGAGLAGLRCADVLTAAGLRVTIIEGRDRIGGRVFQIPLTPKLAAPRVGSIESGIRSTPTPVVDIGPNWIHGTRDNAILELAAKTGTELHMWNENSSTFDSDGRLLVNASELRLADLMWDIVLDAFKYSRANCANIDPQVSLYNYFEEKVKSVVPDLTSLNKAMKDEDRVAAQASIERERELLLQMSEMWGAYVGSPVHSQSLKYFWLEECIEGENLFCANSYQHILREIAEPALAKSTLILNAKATRISTPSSLSSSDTGSNKLLVTTHTGNSHLFDEVVVTAPLGWLKKHHQAVFEPPLPLRIAQAIESVGYGCLEKVYVNFPQAFWLGEQQNPSQPVFKGFGQWLAPRYAPTTNPQRWSIDLVELASMGGGFGHPTLLFYLFGDASRHVTNKVASLSLVGADFSAQSAFVHDVSSGNPVASFLASFLSPYYSLLPNYNPSASDCQPVGFVTTNWLNDELAGNGSYSNFQVGLRNGDQDIEAMRQGVPERGLWLAGEHTAPFVASGTTTGAYWSGEHVAQCIIRHHAEPRVQHLK